MLRFPMLFNPFPSWRLGGPCADILKTKDGFSIEMELPGVKKEDIHIRYCIGEGYAIPSPEGCAAVRRLARSEGILMDPVYTGKAFAGMLDVLSRSGCRMEHVLFLHTGGLPLY